MHHSALVEGVHVRLNATHQSALVEGVHVRLVQKVSRRCPEGVQKVSRRCPEGVQKVSRRCPEGVQNTHHSTLVEGVHVRLVQHARVRQQLRVLAKQTGQVATHLHLLLVTQPRVLRAQRPEGPIRHGKGGNIVITDQSDTGRA
eukprot:1180867-Prorocentrum_minimum.AAC.2